MDLRGGELLHSVETKASGLNWESGLERNVESSSSGSGDAGRGKWSSRFGVEAAESRRERPCQGGLGGRVQGWGRGKNKIRVTETLSHWKPVLYVSEKEKERVKPGMSSPVSLCLTAGPGPHKMPQVLWSDSTGQLAQSSAHNSLQALCYVPFLFLLLFLK